MAQIRGALEVEELRQDEVWSLVGRIVHYAPLIPGGRFNMDQLMKVNHVSEEKGCMVKLSREVKRQLAFWLLLLKATAGGCRIPGEEKLPAWTWEVWTDAAGGSLESVG